MRGWNINSPLSAPFMDYFFIFAANSIPIVIKNRGCYDKSRKREL